MFGWYTRYLLRRGHNLRYDRPERARAALAKAARSDDPEIAAMAQFWLGTVCDQMGDIEAARAAYGRALDSRVPGYGPNAGVLLGEMLLKQGDTAGAQAAFEQTITYRDVPLRPRPPSGSPAGVSRDSINWPFMAAVGLEVIFDQRGDQQGAERARTLTYELAGTDDPAHIELERGGAFNYSFGHFPGAQRAYEQVIAAKHPKWSAAAAHALGGVLRQQGDLRGALAAYERASRFNDAQIAGSARFYMEQVRAQMRE